MSLRKSRLHLSLSIDGHKWFFQISSQWESQKNWFAFSSFGKSSFDLPVAALDLPFMTYVSEVYHCLLLISFGKNRFKPLTSWESIPSLAGRYDNPI